MKSSRRLSKGNLLEYSRLMWRLFRDDLHRVVICIYKIQGRGPVSRVVFLDGTTRAFGLRKIRGQRRWAEG